MLHHAPGHDLAKRPRLIVSRFREKLRSSSCPQLLRLCVHDFGDGVLRPALLVRGIANVTFADVAEAYDISAAIKSAQTPTTVLLRNMSNQDIATAACRSEMRHWPNSSLLGFRSATEAAISEMAVRRLPISTFSHTGKPL